MKFNNANGLSETRQENLMQDALLALRCEPGDVVEARTWLSRPNFVGVVVKTDEMAWYTGVEV